MGNGWRNWKIFSKTNNPQNMTIEEITTRKECQTFDCKSIQIEPKALAVPIVAMANADGGVLAIGVSDKTRRIEGVNGAYVYLFVEVADCCGGRDRCLVFYLCCDHYSYEMCIALQLDGLCFYGDVDLYSCVLPFAGRGADQDGGCYGFSAFKPVSIL